MMKEVRPLRSLLGLFAVLAALAVKASDTKADVFIPIQEVDLLFDKSSKLQFEEVTKRDKEFQAFSSPYIADAGAVWLRLSDLKTLKRYRSTHYLSLVGNASEVDLYYFSDGLGWVHLKNGTLTKLYERSESLDHPAFDLSDLNADHPVYIRLFKPVVPLIAIESKANAYQKEYRSVMYSSVILGFLVFIVLINLYRGIVSQSWIFLLYAVYITFIFLSAFAFNSLNVIHHVLEISPFAKDNLNSISILGLNIAGAAYGIAFLNLRKNGRLFYYILLGLMAVFASMYYIFTNFPNLAPLVGNGGPVLLIVVLALAGIHMWRKGHKYVSYYIVAYGIFGIAHIAHTILRNTDPIYPYDSSIPFFFIGFVAEALLINLSLNGRIDFERSEALKAEALAQEKLIDLKSRQNKELEEQVQKRTFELQMSNEEIVAYDKELQEVNQEIRKRNRELSETLSNLKKTQGRLVESEKMASLGVLSAGIGHEINNPLNYIKNGSKALSTRLREKDNCDDDKVRHLLGIIDEGVDRASLIVKSLGHYSRKGTDIDEECDVHEIIDHCLVMLSSRMKYRLEVEKEYSDQPLVTTGNDGQLHQAFLNILSNAEQAIPEKGKIVIKTDLDLTNHIVVTISDTGTGIEESNLYKIKDPFFTTKDPGVGTGLGLSITNRIIEDHGGSIEVESELGVGTIFKIYLPAN